MNESWILMARDFESKVIDLIKSILSHDEPIELNHRIDRGSVADAFLKKGCHRLPFPDKTLIEIKYRLGYDLLSRVLQRYQPAIDGNHYEKLVIICKESLVPDSLRINDRTEVLTYDTLNSRIGSKQDNANGTTVIQPDNLDKAKEDFANNKATLFLGAGVSMDANFPNWNSLLRGLLAQKEKMPFNYINEANAESILESFSNSSIVAGRYLLEGYSEAIRKENPTISERQISEETNMAVKGRIRKILYKNIEATCSELVKTIAKIAKHEHTQQIITYNYDDLIEAELVEENSFISIYDNSISHTVKLKPIYHVHGFVPRDKNSPGIPVIGEKEYHRLYSRMHHWANVVQLNALYTTTCFFIGFSMTDPNQRRLLDLARNVDLDSIDSDKAQHYVFLLRQKLRGEAIKEVNDEHCNEIEKIMYELGLNVIWFDDFSDLPKCLLYVAGLSKVKPKMRSYDSQAIV